MTALASANTNSSISSTIRRIRLAQLVAKGRRMAQNRLTGRATDSDLRAAAELLESGEFSAEEIYMALKDDEDGRRLRLLAEIPSQSL